MPLLFGNTASSSIQDIVRSSLVAYYDASNINSLSQNTHPYPTDLFAWVGTSVGQNCTLSRDSISSPVGNTPLKMVVTGTDPYTVTYAAAQWNVAAVAPGQTWTVSVWVKADAATTVELFLLTGDANGGYIDGGTAQAFNVDTNWQRISYSFTIGGTASVKYAQVRLDGQTSGTGRTIWWDGVQLEYGSTLTTFNSKNSRFWYDISGVGSNKDLTFTYANKPSATYFNGKYIAFNGSDQKAENTTMSGVMSGLSEGAVCVMYRSKATDDNAMVWDFCNTNGNRDLFSMRQNWAGGQTTGYNATGSLFGTATFGFSSTNVWKHFAFVRRSNVLYAYVNGVLNNTGSTMTDAIGTINKLIIAQDNIGTNFAYADYGHFMAYNKGLTEAEVQQNFNYFRGQYGL